MKRTKDVRTFCFINDCFCNEINEKNKFAFILFHIIIIIPTINIYKSRTEQCTATCKIKKGHGYFETIFGFRKKKNFSILMLKSIIAAPDTRSQKDE